MSARILIVNSNPEEATRIQGWLKDFSACAESDPEAGWRRLGEEPFEAVVLEDGLFDLRHVLRRVEQSRHIGCFVILVGARPLPERALSAVTAGAYAFLLRPLSCLKLTATLRRGLANRKKLLDIVGMAAELREANRKLAQQKRSLEREKRELIAKGRQLNLMSELGCAAGSTLEPARIAAKVSTRLCRELPVESWALLFAPLAGEPAALYLPGPVDEAAAAALGGDLRDRLVKAGGRAQGFEVRPLGRRTLSPQAAARLANEPGLILPLLAGGTPIGLYKLLPYAPLPADLLALAESAANIMALGLRNAGELLAARRLAERDSLTRLANRRAFERQLRREFGRWRRYRQPLTLLMADIDHFKLVNDRYGHQVGDRVLRHVARAIQAAVRDCDFVARYGGEEFAVLLPQTALESGLNLAARLKKLAEVRPPLPGPEPLGLTLSVGLADTLAPQAEDAPDLIRLADHALYLSKNAGRNRISTWRDIADLDAEPAGWVQPGVPQVWQPWEIA